MKLRRFSRILLQEGLEIFDSNIGGVDEEVSIGKVSGVFEPCSYLNGVCKINGARGRVFAIDECTVLTC